MLNGTIDTIEALELLEACLAVEFDAGAGAEGLVYPKGERFFVTISDEDGEVYSRRHDTAAAALADAERRGGHVFRWAGH